MDDSMKALFAATDDSPPTTTALTGRKGSGGAPKGNHNAYKTGLRSSRLGPGMQYIGRTAKVFRATAEAETLSIRGKIGVWEQSLLATATQWLITALKIDRLLREFGDELTHQDYANLCERVARACNERDKCLTKLGLDKGDPQHTTLYALPTLPDEPDAQEGQTNAPIEPSV